MISEPPKVNELFGIVGQDFSTHAEFQCLHCRFYVPLQWPLGADWGVCVNPASPAKAQLRFEHNGCDNHEYRHEELWPQDELIL